jgi:hypothetical protein
MVDAVIVGRILLYFIAHALEFFRVFRYDIAELYWFCMDFYCAVLWMFVIMKWRPSRSDEHLYISNYFLEYCDGILPTVKASVNAWAGVFFNINTSYIWSTCTIVAWNLCYKTVRTKQFTQRLHSLHAVHVLNKSLRYFSLTSSIQRKNTWDCKFEVCSLLKYLKLVDKPVSMSCTSTKLYNSNQQFQEARASIIQLKFWHYICHSICLLENSVSQKY